MTSLPATAPQMRLGLVIDLDTCVGCHACAVACKEWNDGGMVGPLGDYDAGGAKPDGIWLNRVHGYEVEGPAGSRTVYFPRSCLHCEDAACVTVCPTGASYKRAKDGIVLVDEEKCIGCKLCSWACPYGAREYDHVSGVMKKCTLCADRLYNETLPEAERQPACVRTCPAGARHYGDLADPASGVAKLVAARGGSAPMTDLGYRPTNRYLPPRWPARDAGARLPATSDAGGKLLQWVDRLFSR